MSWLSFAAVLALVATIALWRSREVTVIFPPTVGLLYRDGRFVRELLPGRYLRFDPSGRTKVVKVPVTEIPTQLGEVTVLSKDQFSFRLALAPVLKIVNPRAYVESQPEVEQQAARYQVPWTANHAALHALVAAAALEVIASRSLADILANQVLVLKAIQEGLVDAIPGAVVERVLLTGINLPPETRKMFTDVERAKMEAQAGLERARGEQASLRALANAARLVADNPALANLRLLQAVESSKGATTIVVGSGTSLPGLGVPRDPTTST